MNQFTLDCRQLDQWDFVNQPPVAIPSGRGRTPKSPTEVAAMKAAIRLGNLFGVSPLLKTAEEVVNIASPPRVVTSLLKPSKGNLVSPRLEIKFSSSSELTVALALAGSAAAGIGVVGSAGVYGSTVREVGVFFSIGPGIFFNTPGASIGGEYTIILGTPTDFAGPYFGITLAAGAPLSAAVTLLFSPTLPLGIPLVLTLMGLAVNISLSTPTRLPLTVSIEVTNTKISGVRF
jgi:hypothetical protein